MLSFNDQREYDELKSRIKEVKTSLEALYVEMHLLENATTAAKQTEFAKALGGTQAEIDHLYERRSALEG